MSPATRLVIVGPGRVGRSLAAGLTTEEGEPALRGRPADGPDVEEGAPRTLVFAVPDDALAPAARSWAGALASAPGVDAGPAGASGAGPVALHTSGVHGAGALAPLREVGFSVASWHPLTSLAAPSGDAFRGVTFAVSGDAAAAERARRLAERLGGRSVELEAGAHARYHAAAVFASNFLAACLAAAREELGAATGDRAGLDDLAPLARAALENVLELGLPEGLTGPVERGDVGTVRRHLEVLGPRRRGLYRELARELLAVVRDRLPAERRRELRELLGPGDS